jgi:nucleotide-binding universal stress UspA family protein
MPTKCKRRHVVKPIRKILAPTDLSEFSKTGMRYALDLAKAVGAEVTVYWAVHDEELSQSGETKKQAISNEGRMRAFLRKVNSAFDRYAETRAVRSFYAPPPDSLLERHQRALGQFLQDYFSDLLPLGPCHRKGRVGQS